MFGCDGPNMNMGVLQLQTMLCIVRPRFVSLKVEGVTGFGVNRVPQWLPR